MTKNAALELGQFGIRANSIHPGGVDTAMTAPDTLGDAISDEDREATYAMLPLGRVGQPEEIARLAVYLASDESSYSTGAEFIADGRNARRRRQPRDLDQPTRFPRPKRASTARR